MTYEISEAQWKLRVQLAGLFRISAHLGWEDSFNTHCTARVPGTDPPRFLMNPYGVRFDEMKASDLATVDLDGNVVEETQYPVNEAGFVIHSAVHRDRHDALCVIHTHTHAGMAVAAMAHGLLPIGIFALGFHECLSYHDFEGGSGRHNMSERERLAESLGPTNNADDHAQSRPADRRRIRPRGLCLDVSLEPGMRGAGADPRCRRRVRDAERGGGREHGNRDARLRVRIWIGRAG